MRAIKKLRTLDPQRGTHGVRESHTVIAEIATAANGIPSSRRIEARRAQPADAGGGRCLSSAPPLGNRHVVVCLGPA